MKHANPIARRSLLALALVMSIAPAWSAPAPAAASKAERVFQIIDALEVESHWPAGMHVDWKTGIPDGRPEGGSGKHTHCSAFVAAAAMKLGVYILRPPEHPQLLLANAQYDWLLADGRAQGWRQLKDAAAAQAAANEGDLVLAAYHNKRDDEPGHIAIIRPSVGEVGRGARAEPQVTQAGGTNYRSAPLSRGFAGHPRALRDNAVLFFAHAVASASLP